MTPEFVGGTIIPAQSLTIISAGQRIAIHGKNQLLTRISTKRKRFKELARDVATAFVQIKKTKR